MADNKANLFRRWGAGFIDGLIVIPFIFIPILGPAVAVAYELLKDGFFDGASIGKKILNLQVKKLDGSKVDFLTSMKRNFLFAIPYFIMLVPFIGWIFGEGLNFLILIIEGAFVLSDVEGRRIGDRIAETKVIEVTTSTLSTLKLRIKPL